MAIKYAKVIDNKVIEVLIGDENFLTSGLVTDPSQYVAVDGDVGADWTYDEDTSTYRPPKLFESWIWDEDKNNWIAPTPMPDDTTKTYEWNESTQSWVTDL